MEFIKININGNKLTMTVDGIPYNLASSREWNRPHMAMEAWEEWMHYDHGFETAHTYYEWPEHDDFANVFRVLGNDIQTYRIRHEYSSYETNVKRWYYACGDVKARVEHDFNHNVAPLICLEAPETLPKRGRLSAFGLLDPRVDTFEWPRYLYKEVPPCIELVHDYCKTMPVKALMHPTVAKGRITFFCAMRYSPTGMLKKAEVSIIRRQQWNVRVTFDKNGNGKVTQTYRVS